MLNPILELVPLFEKRTQRLFCYYARIGTRSEAPMRRHDGFLHQDAQRALRCGGDGTG